MYLFDDITNRGPDAKATPQDINAKGPQQLPRGSFNNGVDGISTRNGNGGSNSSIDRLVQESQMHKAQRDDNNDDGYSLQTSNPAAMDGPYEEGDPGYGLQTTNTNVPEEPYQSQTEGMRKPDFAMPQSSPQKPGMINRAKDFKKNYQEGKAQVRGKGNEAINKLGNWANDGVDLPGGKSEEEQKEELKRVTTRKIQKAASDRIGKLGDEAFQKQMSAGTERFAGKKFGSTIKDLGSEARDKARLAMRSAKLEREALQGVKTAKTAATAAKGAKTAATIAKDAKTAATAVKGAATAVKGVQGAISLVGAASGPETLGLGTIVSVLLNIAISLGVNDAIDCLFEIKKGDLIRARFLAIRAAMKILMFLVLLAEIALVFSIGGLVIAVPLLAVINIYMGIGLMFPNLSVFQGFTKWEMAIIFMLDVYTSIIVVTILIAALYFVCETTGFGSSSFVGWATWVLSFLKDFPYLGWLGQYADMLNQACTAIRTI